MAGWGDSGDGIAGGGTGFAACPVSGAAVGPVAGADGCFCGIDADIASGLAPDLASDAFVAAFAADLGLGGIRGCAGDGVRLELLVAAPRLLALGLDLALSCRSCSFCSAAWSAIAAQVLSIMRLSSPNCSSALVNSLNLIAITFIVIYGRGR